MGQLNKDKMKERKIKVYLQFPWKNTDSSYYKNLREHPPEGVEYVNAGEFKLIQSKGQRRLNNFMKRIIKRFVQKIYPSMPNIHYTPSAEKYDLIHCTHCLSKNNKPWVADFESRAQFWVCRNKKNSGRENIRNVLLRKNCKKIMPWNSFVKKNIIKLFPGIEGKIEVVHPAVSQRKFKKIKHDKITLIYVARDFYIKGGLIALESLRKIKEKYDVKIFFISNIPSKLRKKYPGITFLDLMPQEDLFEYFKKSDIFFYPSLADTFGFALLEALSFGLPIISIKTVLTPSIEEIVDHGKNGFLIDFPHELNFDSVGVNEKRLVKQLINRLSRLIKNKKLREKMSKNNLKKIADGRFSIKERNKKLGRIYREALE